MSDLLRIVLKKGEERRILRGEFWVYDNEILSPIVGIPRGALAEIFSANNEYVATGYVNPASVIAFRVLSLDARQKIDGSFLKQRILAADSQRLALQPDNAYYRMVYGEADFLPGLVIDRFDDCFIVQITTAGMENFKEEIFAILGELYPSGTVVEKSLAASREKEGLEMINRVITPGKSSEKIIEINDLRFRVDFLKSQKTGFFLDQRENYRLLRNIGHQRNVLDAFCYAGAWGLHAFRYGAKEVTFLEISGEYLKQARENVTLNAFPSEAFTFMQEDAIKKLKEMSLSDKRWDIVILDPPAFVKSRTKLKEGLRGYKEINLRALKMTSAGGFLITCSCSHFLGREEFIRMVYEASADAGRRIKLIELRSQPYDHAVLLPLYQSDYLKCAIFYVY